MSAFLPAIVFSLKPKKSIDNLRIRQESYLFFGIKIFLRLHTDFSMMNDALNKLQFKDYKIYPIKNYKVRIRHHKLLLFIINNKLLFKIVNFVNSKLKFIK